MVYFTLVLGCQGVKKYGLMAYQSMLKIAVVVVLIGALLIPSLSQAADEAGMVYRIGRVDHQHHQLLINDFFVMMPINLETYIFESKTRQTYKVNRYALKAGQIVFFNTLVRNRQTYIDKITIFQP